jgi:hypothetical protein
MVLFAKDILGLEVAFIQTPPGTPPVPFAATDTGKTRTYLDSLCSRQGVRYVCPTWDYVQVFRALQQLLKDVQMGAITFESQIVQEQEIDNWARNAVQTPVDPLGVLRLLADELHLALDPVRREQPAAAT